MSHKPISIDTISLQLSGTMCFERFSTIIYPRKRVLITGANGSGKSTLLKVVQGETEPTQGTIHFPPKITFGYVPQTVIDFSELSGGQRFNKSLSQALSLTPDVLCLDEPTNHLDLNNKKSLIRMLQRYNGTLIIISHDPEVLKLNFDESWHLEHGRVTIFSGNYSDYLREHHVEQELVESQRKQAHKEKRKLKKLLQQEHKRFSKSTSAHINENDRALLGAMKNRGSQTAGKHVKRLSKVEENIHQKLSDTFVYKKIKPNFNIDTYNLSLGKSIVSILNGSCGYKRSILNGINFQLQGGSKVAIIGNNGTGKSTFVKAILKDPSVQTKGEWNAPKISTIGYLDQHYSTLNPNLTVFEIIQEAEKNWTNEEVRKHLNDFLFVTQEDVSKKPTRLSGGEKARLCLAQIAASNPSFLLLDEITNNVDLETKDHIIEVLKAYPGAMIVVSHDPEFIKQLAIPTVYKTENGQLNLSEEIK